MSMTVKVPMEVKCYDSLQNYYCIIKPKIIMLITRVSLLPVFFFVCFALNEKSYSRFSYISHLLKNRSYLKKRQSDPEYFEQCRFVNVWKEQLGHVNVLAFLDPSWQYSFRQAVMLRILNARFRKSGFSDVRFFVIAPPPDWIEDKIENEIEIQAWRDIPIFEPEDFMNTKNHFMKDMERPEIIFIQDNLQLRIWERFRASKDQIVVIDRCGRLTYQVIVPWSILYFPYVKAAILSTYHEDPCGTCDPTTYEALEYEDYLFHSINRTDKVTNPHKIDDMNADPTETIRTEQLENTTKYLSDSIEYEHEASTTPSVPLIEWTDANTAVFNSSITKESFRNSETTYQYDSTTNKNNLYTEIIESHEESRDLENSTISSILVNLNHEKIIASNLEQDISLKQQKSMQTSMDDFATTNYRDEKNHTILNESNNKIKSNLSIVTKPILPDGEIYNSKNGKNATGAKRFEDNVSNIGNEMNALPLRIIMHAPHIHENGKKTKKHMHLILKIGSPGYHGHIDSNSDDALSLNSWQNSDLQKSSKEHDSQTTEQSADRESIIQNYTFDKDESPGLYGEVADYWRSCENSDITDRNETSNDDNGFSISLDEEYNAGNVSDYVINLSKSIQIKENFSTTMKENAEDSIVSTEDTIGLHEINTFQLNINEQINKEEELRNKLIQHYSKLIPWIYYVLHK